MRVPSRAWRSTDRHRVENYLLENDEWKDDIIPEIMDGKNIADFIDPDILEKLDALEREEEKLEAEGFYASDSDIVRTFFFYFRHSDSACSSTRMTSAKPSQRKPRARRS